jgi:hypothetical protein
MGLRLLRGPPASQPSARRWQHLVATPWQQPAQQLEGAGEAPCGGSDSSVPKIDDEAILRRAKNLCVQNGNFWDASELHQAERWDRKKIVIDGAGRRKYLALARELLNESGDA